MFQFASCLWLVVLAEGCGGELWESLRSLRPILVIESGRREIGQRGRQANLQVGPAKIIARYPECSKP